MSYKGSQPLRFYPYRRVKPSQHEQLMETVDDRGSPRMARHYAGQRRLSTIIEEEETGSADPVLQVDLPWELLEKPVELIEAGSPPVRRQRLTSILVDLAMFFARELF